MMESGIPIRLRKGMVAVNKSGPTEAFMTATGRMTRPMGADGSSMLMEISTMVIGRMIKLTALANIPILMAPSTRATGLMTSSTASAWSTGPMARNTKAAMSMARRKARADRRASCRERVC